MVKAKKRIFRRNRKEQPVAAECYFCVEKKVPDYSDVSNLQKFLSDRGKIVARSRNGLCARHQRRLSDAVKYARHLALLPFVVRD